MDIWRFDEHEIDAELAGQIGALLTTCFSDFPADRIYYKQPPRFRLLAFEGGELTAQVGVEYRAIGTMDGPATIFGVEDLCVAPAHRSKGLASALLSRVETVARAGGADFILLFADDHRVYLANGYTNASNRCRWLRIHEHRTLGIAEESLADCLMVKPVGDRSWPAGTIDLLGFVF